MEKATMHFGRPWYVPTGRRERGVYVVTPYHV